MPSFTVEWWCADTSAQGDGGSGESVAHARAVGQAAGAQYTQASHDVIPSMSVAEMSDQVDMEVFRATAQGPTMTVADTFYIGLTDGLQLGAQGGWAWGVAVDDSLNFRILHDWQVGGGVGGRGWAGMQIQTSTAATVWDLGGPFSYVSGGAGFGGYAAFDAFWGSSDHGFVVGDGFTIGLDVGGGYSAGVSNTTVHGAGPAPKIPYYLERP